MQEWPPVYSVSNANKSNAGAIILRVAYGYEVKENNDPFIELADIATEQFSRATQPGAYLVDVIPMRKYLVHRTFPFYNNASSEAFANLVPWCWLPQDRKRVGCYPCRDGRSTVQLGEARNGMTSFRDLPVLLAEII